MQVPVLESERLLLRGHTADDFPHSSAMWADPAVTRFIREKPFTREESWARFLRYIGHWCLFGYGYWVLCEKSSGLFVGEGGLADYHRDVQPSIEGIPETGWVLATAFHGRGYATEAVRRITVWADTQLHAPKTACIIAPENIASIRVAEKCGYREHQRTSYQGDPTLLFLRPNPSEG